MTKQKKLIFFKYYSEKGFEESCDDGDATVCIPDRIHVLIMFPYNRVMRICFIDQNQQECFAKLCVYLQKGEFAQATIKKLKQEAKITMGMEE